MAGGVLDDLGRRRGSIELWFICHVFHSYEPVRVSTNVFTTAQPVELAFDDAGSWYRASTRHKFERLIAFALEEHSERVALGGVPVELGEA